MGGLPKVKRSGFLITKARYALGQVYGFNRRATDRDLSEDTVADC